MFVLCAYFSCSFEAYSQPQLKVTNERQLSPPCEGEKKAIFKMN